ncbi:MAG: hypothetical protein AABX32_06295 [Nanoarchaeota archaeon]
MKKLFRKPYLYWMLGIFFAYLSINIFLSQFYVTLIYIPYYVSTINWGQLLLGIFLSIAISALVSMNLVLLYIRHLERKSISKESTVTFAASVGGLATGVCTVCASSFLPEILGFFGVSFSFFNLPFKGIELQLGVIALLLAGIYFSRKQIH